MQLFLNIEHSWADWILFSFFFVGLKAWNSYPTLKCLMEMAMTKLVPFHSFISIVVIFFVVTNLRLLLSFHILCRTSSYVWHHRMSDSWRSYVCMHVIKFSEVFLHQCNTSNAFENGSTESSGLCKRNPWEKKWFKKIVYILKIVCIEVSNPRHYFLSMFQ